MRTIALTGGIGSGKSTVAGMLRDLGARVIDADQVAREVVEPGQPALAEIVAWFGPGILRSDGQLNRPALASRIFTDSSDRERLNSIVHPRVGERLRAETELAQREGLSVLIIDIPLLFESQEKYVYDEVWVVWAPEVEQVRRIVARDGLSTEQAAQRLAAQIPLAEKCARADRVINNDGSLVETRRQVEEFFAHPVIR